MVVVKIAHAHGASPDFIADVLVQGKHSHPKARCAEDLKPVRGKSPKFVILNGKTLEKGFESKERKHYRIVHQLVLMDGLVMCGGASCIERRIRSPQGMNGPFLEGGGVAGSGQRISSIKVRWNDGLGVAVATGQVPM